MSRIDSSTIKLNLVDLFVVVLIFMYGLSFYLQYSSIMIILLLVTLLFYTHKGLYFNIQVLAISFLFLTYAGFSLVINNENNLITVMSWFCMYLIGFVLMQSSSQNKEKFLKNLLIYGSLGLLIHCYLNVFISGEYYYLRQYYDYWNGNLIKATQLAAWAGTVLGVLYYWFTNFKQQSAIIKVLSILSCLCVLLISLNIASRTLIISILLMLIFVFFEKMKKRKTKEQHFHFLLFTLILFFLVYFLFWFNLWGARDYIEESNLLSRWSNLIHDTNTNDGGRLTIWLYSINHLDELLFGGYNAREAVGELHNLWLDMLDAVGIIPFSFLLIVTFQIINNLRKLLKTNNISNQFVSFMHMWYFFAFIQLFIEPVLNYGYINYLGFFWFVSGGLNGITIRRKEYEYKKF
ncbi:hypothetical protein [Marinilactibacillus psychrotolerans]|uniref:hypothetical protein n=1 Tax=Marinilactibacillus psychrotolerans TaxID=191770 RepID=UPI00388AF85A